ncbi:chemotaxis protein CheW [Massilia putida]|uniref:chemotaxis protein CheW n=1 Tax=Massilia putida TaxID=1141883 RepID=UPI0009525090|nr:chemotaxis protein CheW [Massilia putida]
MRVQFAAERVSSFGGIRNEARTLLPTMAATRAGFQRLEQELVGSLVQEKVGNVLAGIATQAQYAIDLVVRNLYERTADIGFLATDRELCSFAAGQADDVHAVRRRLRAYRSKYTVYDDILILDTHGRMLARIDETHPLAISSDALVAQSLASPHYVETFRASDLRPDKTRALIYSRRMLHPDSGVPIGVLCLCFNFEEEMAGIFRSLADEDGRTLLLLLDGDGRVIASADPDWVREDSRVPLNLDGEARLLLHCGREYLVSTQPAAGYQGYKGPPGWHGQVMTPVDVAFRRRPRAVLDHIPAAVAEGLLTHARSFCPPLFDIITAADTVRRVVWNGQVATAGCVGDVHKLKTVLAQVGETGARSNELFGQSIGDLYETALASHLRDAESVARLLVDLLDRNLYERSDDCRWWALTPELRHALTEPEQDFETREHLGEILDYINGLYTVYTRLFVYDSQGRILVSSSRDGAASMAGERIDEDTLAAVLALRGEQQYHVTPFRPDPLYDGRPTYVYHAAIRDPGMDAGGVVGGIGIVFDAEAEFSAMLKGALGDTDNASALFVDRGGRVIASTDRTRPVGARIELDPQLLALDNGRHASRVVEHDGQYAVMACCASSGYREFKVSDGYRDDVLALVFLTFGAVCPRQGGARRTVTGPALLRTEAHGGTPDTAGEFATFVVDGTLFAVPAASVLEARSASEISPVSMGGRRERMGVIAARADGDGDRFVWVFDLGCLMRGTPSTIGQASQAIVLRHGSAVMAILADDLDSMLSFHPSHIMPSPVAGGADGLLVKQVVRANGGGLIVQILDVIQLFTCIEDPSLPTILPIDVPSVGVLAEAVTAT